MASQACDNKQTAQASLVSRVLSFPIDHPLGFVLGGVGGALSGIVAANLLGFPDQRRVGAIVGLLVGEGLVFYAYDQFGSLIAAVSTFNLGKTALAWLESVPAKAKSVLEGIFGEKVGYWVYKIPGGWAYDALNGFTNAGYDANKCKLDCADKSGISRQWCQARARFGFL